MQVAGLVHDLGKLLYFFGAQCVLPSALVLTVQLIGFNLALQRSMGRRRGKQSVPISGASDKC